MSSNQLRIILAGSGYLGKSIIDLANNYTYESIIEYSRTLKDSIDAEYVCKDFEFRIRKRL